MFPAPAPIRPGLVNLVRQDRFRITAELPPVILRNRPQIGALIVIAPTGLLQKGIALHHREMELLPILRGIRPLSPIDRANKGLRQADDAILAGMGVVFVHFPLLGIDHRDYLQPFQKPARQLDLRGKYHELCKTLLSLFNVFQLFPNGFPELLCRPALGFCDAQVGFPGFLRGIRQLVACMGQYLPEYVDRRFKMCPTLVQQVYVCGIFDVRRRHRGVHDQLPTILLSALFLPGCIWIFLSLQGFRSSGGLPGIIMIVLFGFIIPIHIPSVLRPFPGADVLVDPGYILYREPLAEMHHHGRVEQQLLPEFLEPEEVLHVGILLDLCYAFLVCKIYSTL